MARDDWFRNTQWDENIEASFQKKLARARQKSHYLRIQAGYLAERFPHSALRLLDQYFALGDDLEHAQAHVERATAYRSLGNVDAAIAAYEAALAREASFPNLLTQAYLELPYLIATQPIPARYQQALEVLDKGKTRPFFHSERFRWHCSVALIRASMGQIPEAGNAARAALTAAAQTDSGLRYHPKIGLVAGVDDALLGRLSALADATN